MRYQYDEATYCEDCTHCMREKSTPAYRWLCRRHKRIDGQGFVSKDHSTSPPFLYCKDVNGGLCELYEELITD